MNDYTTLQCLNCGTELGVLADDASGMCCPVCQFYNDVRLKLPVPMITVEELEVTLDALITQARASGVSKEEIVRVLRDELEFSAEMAHIGRRLCVHIIDLGPMDTQQPQTPMRDRSAVLRGRMVGR